MRIVVAARCPRRNPSIAFVDYMPIRCGLLIFVTVLILLYISLSNTSSTHIKHTSLIYVSYIPGTPGIYAPHTRRIPAAYHILPGHPGNQLDTITTASPQSPTPLSLVKMTTIFSHQGCISYFLSPLHLYEHMWSAHPESTLAVQTRLGQQGLDALVIRQHMHTTDQPGARRVYLCSTCQMIFPTSFAAQGHLERTQQHAAEVQHARWVAGYAGVAQLVTEAWLQTPAAVRVLTADVCLTLLIRNYTNRARYPTELSLEVLVPRVTATVSALAERIEEAFVILGGERERISWSDMVNVVGLSVVGRNMRVKNDSDVKAWVRAAGAEEKGEMDGEAD